MFVLSPVLSCVSVPIHLPFHFSFSIADQFSDARWVCYSSLHLWHQLSRVSESPTNYGLLPRDCPHFRFQWQVLGILKLPTLLPGQLQIQGFPWLPPLGFSNLLEQYTDLTESAILTITVYYKGYNSGTNKWKRRKGEVWVEGHRSSCPMQSGHKTWLVHGSVPQPGSSSNFIVQGFFIEVLLPGHTD